MRECPREREDGCVWADRARARGVGGLGGGGGDRVEQWGEATATTETVEGAEAVEAQVRGDWDTRGGRGGLRFLLFSHNHGRALPPLPVLILSLVLLALVTTAVVVVVIIILFNTPTA